MTISDFLRAATARLQAAGIQTARLDAQIIAGVATRQNRAWVLAHDDAILGPTAQAQLERMVSARAKRTPMAYVTGSKEFYGRPFFVTPDVLIPRPETEEVLEQLKALGPMPGDNLLDVGTGSGAIAITAALTWPTMTVMATDVSPAALAIAKQNATHHQAPVAFTQSNLLHSVPTATYRFITANLPYVSRAWERSPETNAEPALALFAPDDGLALIKKLIAQAPQALVPHGYLLLEADPRQHTAITEYAQSFTPIATSGFIIVLQRR